MRLLYLARVSGVQHMRRKARWQAEGLAKCGPDFHACVVSGSPLNNDDMGLVKLIHSEHPDAEYGRIFAAIAKAVKPDIIFMRYPLATAQLYEFISQHPNVVFEHNTIEEKELEGGQLLEEMLWAPEVLPRAAGFAGVTEEILKYEQARCGRNLPGIVIGNGIDLSQVPLLKYNISKKRINLFCSALFSPWHGLERLFEGLAAYRGNTEIYVHLAGAGKQLEVYKRIIRRLGLEGQVFFHGYMDRQALYRMASVCHLGIGTLGPGAIKLTEIASLKHREYCGMGLPFIYSGKDADFPPEVGFAHAIPLQGPVNIEKMLEFCWNVYADKDIHRKMRTYAEENLSWDVKCKKLYRFLSELHRGRQATSLGTAHIDSEIELWKRIEKASVSLSQKIAQLNLDELNISDYNKKYFRQIIGSKSELERIRFLNIDCPKFDKYKLVLFYALKTHKKDPGDLFFLEHGGGSGCISLLAKELGMGNVFYNDIYDISCHDSEVIASALGLPGITRICGDLPELSAYCQESGVRFDAVGSYDAIEHIYDIHGFLAKLHEICTDSGSIFLCSGANSYNKSMVDNFVKGHIRLEFEDRERVYGHKERDSLNSYASLREGIIRQFFIERMLALPQDSTLSKLVRSTRGLIKQDIEKALEVYLETGQLPETDKRFPSNTCDPLTGNWGEHLMDFEALRLTLLENGFAQCSIYPEQGRELSKIVALAAVRK